MAAPGRVHPPCCCCPAAQQRQETRLQQLLRPPWCHKGTLNEIGRSFPWRQLNSTWWNSPLPICVKNMIYMGVFEELSVMLPGVRWQMAFKIYSIHRISLDAWMQACKRAREVQSNKDIPFLGSSLYVMGWRVWTHRGDAIDDCKAMLRPGDVQIEIHFKKFPLGIHSFWQFCDGASTWQLSCQQGRPTPVLGWRKTQQT